MDGHLTPRLALAMIEAAGCRKAVLSHLSPDSEKELRRLRRPANVLVARDLMRVSVRP